MKIQRELIFSAAHRLMEHEGKCRGLHGHNWRVIITLYRDEMIDGMVADFGAIKQAIVKRFDHACILYKDDPLVEYLKDYYAKVVVLDDHPTCEVLAKEIANDIAKTFRPWGVDVRVEETPGCFAEYIWRDES